MNARNELQLAISIVVLLNLTLAFGAVGLFARMGPAIDRILDENATSIVAAERMTLSLSKTTENLAELRPELQTELTRLSQNVTEPEEGEVIDKLSEDLAQLEQPGGRERLLQHLVRVSEINHAAMERAGAAATRIGNAGAWAAVWVGLLSLSLTLVVLSRLRQRLIEPLEVVAAVLRDTREGDHRRRCHAIDAPPQLERIMEDLNRLLDQHEQLQRAEAPRENELRYRHIIQGLLEQLPQPAAVSDPTGAVLFTNLPMLDALSAPNGAALRDVMTNGATAGPGDSTGVKRTPLPQNAGILWVNRQS